jgi:hypothetical protein
VIQAVLSGKSAGYEYSEDVLTSTIFGTLKYLPAPNALIPFIESAFLDDDERTKLWSILCNQGIDLRSYREVQYIFWAWNQKYGEPDLVLLFTNHIHGQDDLLLLIEAKFKSGKSGYGEYDQLMRYYKAIKYDINNFQIAEIANFKGKYKYLIFLTESEASSDIEDSSQQIKIACNNDFNNEIFHLRWHQLIKVLDSMNGMYSPTESIIADDLKQYLERIGLRDFSGISLPDDNISKVIHISGNVFFDQSKSGKYFSSIPITQRLNNEFCFYKGE